MRSYYNYCIWTIVLSFSPLSCSVRSHLKLSWISVECDENLKHESIMKWNNFIWKHELDRAVLAGVWVGGGELIDYWSKLLGPNICLAKSLIVWLLVRQLHLVNTCLTAQAGTVKCLLRRHLWNLIKVSSRLRGCQLKSWARMSI